MRYPHLMTPIRIGPLELKNRVVMSPLTTNYAEQRTGFVTEQMLEYYGERANGGVGLIIVEGAIVREDGRGFSKQLFVDRDETIEGLSRLAAKIKENGSRALLQIMHHGRQTRSEISGYQPVAPSSIPCPVYKDTPKELSIQDISEIKTCFVEAAVRAKKAGFDGVEIHAAHGYLVSEFLSPWSNHRTDLYGGTLINRMRFLLEIIDETKRRTGHDFAIFCRLSANEFVEGGLEADEIIKIGKMLKTAGVHALDISAGVAATFIKMSPPTGSPEAPYTEVAEKVKREVGLPVITVVRILTPDKAEEIIKDRKADLVALGRALVADPHWVNKAAASNELFIIPCIGCNVCNGRSSQPEVTCIANPFTGREHKFDCQKTLLPKKIAVIGNGIAGYHAAIVLHQRGHQVNLFSQSNLPFGGLTGLRSRGSLQAELNKLVSYFNHYLQQLDMSIEDFRKFSVDEYDLVINTMLDLVDQKKAVEAWHEPWLTKIKQAKLKELHAVDILLGHFPPDEQVYVVGGNLLGCEVANALADRYKVSIVEDKKRVPFDVGNTIMKMIQTALKQQGVSINPPGIVEEIVGPATVIWATSYPKLFTLSHLENNQKNLIYDIGDAYQPDTMASLMVKVTELVITI